MFFFVAWGPPGFARDTSLQNQEKNIRLDQLVEACLKKSNRDNICEGLIQIKQTGDDAIETIKSLYPMGPYEYALLTVANAALTGRLRIRTGPFIHRRIENVIDITSERFVLNLSLRF